MDMLCLLFECPIRGVFVDAGGRPWGDEEVAAAIGGDMASNLECIRELLAKGVAQRDQRGAIYSRRMVRDEQERQNAKERKRKQRAGQSSGVPANEGGFRSEIQPALFATPQLVEPLTAVDRIAHLHPANTHLKNKPIPLAQRIAIADAIARDGEEAVLSGTKSLAAGVAEWDPNDLRFIPNPIRFYQECGYLKPPETWQRNRKKSRSEKCMLHPQAALTEWGECGECYGNKYVSGCQPA